MGTLAEILSSRVRAEIFRLLFGAVDRELHVREIERQTGFSIGTVRQELDKLVRLDLAKARRDSNRRYFRANKEHPLYPDIRSLVVKTTGLVDVLREALDREGVEAAFVFGSVAEGHEAAASDVDLMVIGRVSLRTLSGWLSGVSERIGREVNPHVFTQKEFSRRKREGDHFLTQVLKSRRLFVKGGEHELAALG